MSEEAHASVWGGRWDAVRKLIGPKGSTMGELKMQAARSKQPTKAVEETLYWADMRGLVERFDRWDGKRAWRLPPETHLEVVAPSPVILEEKPQEVPAVPSNESNAYVDTNEAAKILGISSMSVRRMADRIKGGRERVGGRGREYPRAVVVALAEERRANPPARGGAAHRKASTRLPPERVAPPQASAPAASSAPPDTRLELLETLLKLLVSSWRSGAIPADKVLRQLAALIEVD